MQGVKAGVIVTTRFCSASSKVFYGYINYIDRKEATRNDHLNEFNLYNDYMDNPNKTTGLFTNTKSSLTNEEKQNLKEIFKVAQDNDSLMWQTVISFDNRWLEEHGLYQSKEQIVDERKLKEITTGAVNKMLKNEGLENAIWSAAVHFNTDNIHIHIATIEPVPMRAKKDYKQYVYIEDADGNYIQDRYGKWIYLKDSTASELIEDGKFLKRYRKETVLDEMGNPVYAKEYVGVFKERSIEICKSHIVEEILNQREQNLLINNVIRNQIVKQKKEIVLAHDPELRLKFLEIYEALPKCGNRGLWNYGNKVMYKLHPLIDELSTMFMEKYFSKEFSQLKETIQKQAEQYKEAYGNSKSGRNYRETKLQDLYSRLGNAILKEMVAFDRNIESGIEFISEEDIEYVQQMYLEDISKVILPDSFDDYLEPEDVPDAFIEWSENFKRVKKMFIGSNPDYANGVSEMLSLSQSGNVLATFELGNIFKYGKGVDIDLDNANKFYKNALDKFQYIYDHKLMNSDNSKFLESYLSYRIGAMHYHGLGTEKNYEAAIPYLDKASKSNNSIAMYYMGNIYYSGNGIERDLNKAIEYYERSNNAFAYYRLGSLYRTGSEVKLSEEKSNMFYEKAFEKFLLMERKNPDANTEYKLGSMYLHGFGIDADKDKAREYFEKSAKAGNCQSQYQMAKIYIEMKDESKLKLAMSYLHNSANKGNNQMAQMLLGDMYMDKTNHFYNIEKAELWLLKAANNGNELAQYKLGKFYMEKEEPDISSAIVWFEKCAQKNMWSKYRLGKIYTDETMGYYNLERGISLLEQSVKEGNELALYKVGKLYMNPELPIYDSQKGISYLKESADNNNQYAQLSLGLIYLQGEKKYPGVNVNKTLAEEYLSRAASNGNELAWNILNNPYDPNSFLKASIVQRNIFWKNYKASYAFSQAIRSLQKSFQNEWEKEMNMREFEKLKEKEHSKEFSRT